MGWAMVYAISGLPCLNGFTHQPIGLALRDQASRPFGHRVNALGETEPPDLLGNDVGALL